MRLGVTPALCLLMLIVACSGHAPELPTPRAEAPLATIPADQWTEARIAIEVERLRAALAEEVPQHTRCGAASDLAWIAPAQAAIAAAAMTIDRPQLLVVVNRNPMGQQLCIVLARRNARWQVIGGSKVSTGQAGRPASQGCVRISATMSRFLDRHGVLDASYERAARADDRILAVLLPDRQPTPLACDALVNIDSSEQG